MKISRRTITLGESEKLLSFKKVCPKVISEFQVRFWQFECRSKNEQSESKIRIHSVQLHLQPPNFTCSHPMIWVVNGTKSKATVHWECFKRWFLLSSSFFFFNKNTPTISQNLKAAITFCMFYLNLFEPTAKHFSFLFFFENSFDVLYVKENKTKKKATAKPHKKQLHSPIFSSYLSQKKL